MMLLVVTSDSTPTGKPGRTLLPGAGSGVGSRDTNMKPSSRRPRVRVISCGGTWCMHEKKTESAHVFTSHRVAESLGRFDFDATFPAVTQLAETAFHEFAALDSSNMGPTDWSRLSEFIANEADAFDGFVILQGTDTLGFTSCALSYSLSDLGKPIVLTGAQLSLDVPGSDAPTNIVNAVRLAAHRDRDARPVLREIAVVFGSRIIRGTRCRKYSERDLEAFDSVNVPVIGRFQTTLFIDREMLLTRATPERLQPATAFDPNVALVTLYPGISPRVIRTVGDQSSAVVIAGFGAGNIPSSSESFRNPLSLEDEIKRLTNAAKPVVLTTQCVTGQAEVGRYETGSRAKLAGAIVVNDMTPESAYVKVSWLLANRHVWAESKDARHALNKRPDLEALRYALLHAYSGEVTPNQKLFS